ncbi:FAD-binding domain-containing protein [Rickenella mellea]|uniref:FAD-binding domain-containing protein n=1 Tax=Rickenella mellea TaxID=50990 RepID=A0A4Y7QLZ1_9AGAM|nr:FAD-binding domain-containing protein [Rickenella mellea]
MFDVLVRSVPSRTSLRYLRSFNRVPSLVRDLSSVTAEDVTHFSKILSPSCVLSTFPPSSAPVEELANFNSDWMGKYKGASTTVLKPKNTQQVSEILKWCWERRIGVVPQGGNTGLVGGSVPVNDEVILSLRNMNNIRSFDPVSGILVTDAGCILESLTEFIAPHRHIMPLDLGAKGSCMIGGNVSTNAGGLRLLRYGSLHGSVLGLEVVLPDGTVMNQLSTLRKDNTGYDLKQLFIGAEGTLGVVTGVSILTAAAPEASNNVILVLRDFKDVLPLYQIVKQHLSEILSAFEFIDKGAYDLATKHGQGRALDDSDVEGAGCFVLVETSGGKREHDEEKLNELLESLLSADKPLITTGVLSQSPAQFSSLWALREGVTEAVSKEGKAYKYDISIPLSAFKDVVDATREHLRKKGLMRDDAVKHVIGYGHVGDGNLHLNVVAQTYSKEIESALEPFVYELVESYRGSISAEHGVGVMKTHALHYTKDAVSIEWMKKIKELFDERGIMNPGKVIV